MVPERVPAGEDSPADRAGGHPAGGHRDGGVLRHGEDPDRGAADLRAEPGLQPGVPDGGGQAVQAPQHLHPVRGERHGQPGASVRRQGDGRGGAADAVREHQFLCLRPGDDHGFQQHRLLHRRQLPGGQCPEQPVPPYYGCLRLPVVPEPAGEQRASRLGALGRKRKGRLLRGHRQGAVEPG